MKPIRTGAAAMSSHARQRHAMSNAYVIVFMLVTFC